jgi:hypothetical protein
MVQINRVPVEFGDAFPFGAFVLSVAAVYDFEASTKDRKVQALDKESNLPQWVAECLDGDPEARDKTFKVKFASAVQPVAPPQLPGTPVRPVEFEGLTVTAWVDSSRCTAPKQGQGHMCRAKQGVSLNATGMRAPSVGTKPRNAAAGDDGKAA